MLAYLCILTGMIRNLSNFMSMKCPMCGQFFPNQTLSNQYATELRTVKCWHKIVFHLINRTVTNAYICYKNNTNDQTPSKKKLTHLQFRI